MAISYGTSSFNFVDSVSGTASSGNVKNLVPIAIDRQYHKSVQKKLFFTKTGMIGPDGHAEGTATQTAPGTPVIRKTELSNSPGDSIRVGLLRNLSTAISTGVVGATQLVDSEVGASFHDVTVKINQWRNGVRTDGGINSQRNPYKPLEQIEIDLLSDWQSQIMDTSILYSEHYGFSPQVFRVLGHTDAAPTANVNTLFGNDLTLDTTRTIANIVATGDDNVNARTFEVGALYMEQGDFDPVIIDGEPYWCAIVSPAGALRLLQDDRFRTAMLQAMERGKTNPLFKSVTFLYNNCMIYKYDKIRTILNGNNPAGLTVSAQVITEAVYTGIGGGVAATNLHATTFLGANSVMLAEGQLRMAERIRAENDYGNIIGRAVDGVWGAKRADFIPPGGGTNVNQSSLQIVNTLIN